jgi:endonuclease/exonuclease/phosphatase family metal-dependent hydrolase
LLPEREEINVNPNPQGSNKFTRTILKLKHPRIASQIQHIVALSEPTSRLYKHRSLHHRQSSRGRTLTVLSSNLWHDWPRHRQLRERLEAFAWLVEEESADIILLQEVARTQQVKSDEWLANRLGMSYIYSRVNGSQEIGFEEGLAVFSHYPLNGTHVRQLSSPLPFVRRMALGVDISTPSGNMLAVSVHLGLARNTNALQQDQLRGWIANMQTELPVIIGGDFNAHETSPQILQTRSNWVDTFRYTHPGEDGSTHALHWPWGGAFHRRRLDYIFLQAGKNPLKILDTAHLLTRGLHHSDHRAVLARLQPW